MIIFTLYFSNDIFQVHKILFELTLRCVLPFFNNFCLYISFVLFYNSEHRFRTLIRTKEKIMSKIKENEPEGSFNYYVSLLLKAETEDLAQTKQFLFSKSTLSMLLLVTFVCFFIFISLGKNGLGLGNAFDKIFCLFMRGTYVYLLSGCYLVYFFLVSTYLSLKKSRIHYQRSFFQNLILTILKGLFFHPMAAFNKSLRWFAGKTNTTTVLNYLQEATNAVLYAVVYSALFLGILASAFAVCSEPIDKILTKHPAITSKTIICYFFLCACLVYRYLRNTFLKKQLKKNPKANEWSAETLTKIQKQLSHELNTFTLIMILFATVILTPLNYAKPIESDVSFAILYICVVITAAFACQGNFK